MHCPKHEPVALVVPARAGLRYGALVRCRLCGRDMAMSPPQPSADAAADWGRRFIAWRREHPVR